MFWQEGGVHKSQRQTQRHQRWHAHNKHVDAREEQKKEIRERERARAKEIRERERVQKAHSSREEQEKVKHSTLEAAAAAAREAAKRRAAPRVARGATGQDAGALPETRQQGDPQAEEEGT